MVFALKLGGKVPVKLLEEILTLVKLGWVIALRGIVPESWLSCKVIFNIELKEEKLVGIGPIKLFSAMSMPWRELKNP